ncbi:hypothetical protein QR680_009328 [Steinernema hermaphroditum]|uniref:ATP synthase peripheral stalk subunit OSCP, mitochondrial n=1 Tax=Steinernema hermaphroditum TaxID=289476 RepID=A0AA39M985_9BILA|nr:hypothetical protein QR680_009328 [Steinernema hermaphroditum]
MLTSSGFLLILSRLPPACRILSMNSLAFKRSLSLSSVAQQLVKTPIQAHGIEGRYASALYSAAFKKKSLDTVDSDLKKIRDMYQTNTQFKEFVLDPTLKRHKKKDAVQAVLSKVGVSSESQNFLALLAENGRLNKLEAVINSFESIMRAHRGELFVQVTTAEPLAKNQESALHSALQKFAQQGQKLHVTLAVNPKLIGGMIVNIGDKYVDMSIDSRIKKYQQVLESAV